MEGPANRGGFRADLAGIAMQKSLLRRLHHHAPLSTTFGACLGDGHSPYLIDFPVYWHSSPDFVMMGSTVRFYESAPLSPELSSTWPMPAQSAPEVRQHWGRSG